MGVGEVVFEVEDFLGVELHEVEFVYGSEDLRGYEWRAWVGGRAEDFLDGVDVI